MYIKLVRTCKFERYAEMCLVSGDEGCLVVMVLVGFSVVGLLVASGPSGSLPALD